VADELSNHDAYALALLSTKKLFVLQ